MASFTPISLDSAEKNSQDEHRLQLINTWRILPGSKILEIGCGQGNCTTVLAAAVGPSGHIDAVDPGPPDYGSPWTLAQAQAHVSAGEMGSRITWHNAEPSDFLAASDKKWDYAVFAHCIWYFNNREVLARMLRALKGRVSSILVAEYALKASERDAQPHLLAAIARASLEAHNDVSDANIRCVLSPAAIKEVAENEGWKVGQEANIVPAHGLEDGSWETNEVRSKDFVQMIDNYITSPRVREMLLSSREAVIAAHAVLDGRKTRTMDVWVTSLN